MGDYITIQWGASAPAAGAIPTNKCAVIGRDPLTGDDKVIVVNSAQEAWDAGISEDSDLGRFITSFYAQDGVGQAELDLVPFNSTQFPGETFTGIECVGSEDEFRVPAQPANSVTNVKVDFGDGSGQIAQTITTHYTLEATGSIYSGKITFATTGPVDVGGVIYSGQVPTTAKVFADYTTDGFSQALERLLDDDIDVQFIGLAHDVVTPLAFSNGAASGLINDFKYVNQHCTGSTNNNRWRQAVVALPKTAKPNASAVAYGGAATWGDLRGDIGSSKNFIVIKANPNETSGVPNDDPCGVYLGLIAATPPHENLTLHELTISQTTFDSKTYQQGWKGARIGCLIKEKLDTADATLLSYGYTFGSDREDRINNVRCKYLLARLLYTNLFALLKTQKARYDARGLDLIESTIAGTLAYAQKLEYIDGTVSIVITSKELFTAPYASLSAAQKVTYAALKASRKVTATVTYLWSENIEQIELNPMLEV